jgi:hypothetical protein
LKVSDFLLRFWCLRYQTIITTKTWPAIIRTFTNFPTLNNVWYYACCSDVLS